MRRDCPQPAWPVRAESPAWSSACSITCAMRCREGKNVKISGFGSFILRDKGERVGRNPKTGIEVPIAPRRVMTFRASQIMRDQIAG